MAILCREVALLLHQAPYPDPTSSRVDRRYSALYTPAARPIVEAAHCRELDRSGYPFLEP